jgi:hypothetical protein
MSLEECIPYTVNELYKMATEINNAKIQSYVRTYYDLILTAVNRGKYETMLVHFNFDYEDQEYFTNKAIEIIKKLFNGIIIIKHEKKTIYPQKFTASWNIEKHSETKSCEIVSHVVPNETKYKMIEKDFLKILP